MNFSTGISLYFSTDFAKNIQMINQAINAEMEYIFTSLHIPEENFNDKAEEIKELLNLCKKNNLKVICDISPLTLKKLHLKDYLELKQLGISHIRLDFGFSDEETLAFLKDFTVVFNASTFDFDLLNRIEKKYINKIMACHNFYPKKYTALSLERIKEINYKLNLFNIKVISFVMGNKEFRGPLFEGLPTVESQRNHHVFENVLELKESSYSDVVIIGDVACLDDVYEKLANLNQGFIDLKVTLNDDFHWLYGIIQHDRVDSSEFVIRSVESRAFKQEVNLNIKPNKRKIGDIVMANEQYLRYFKELEICKKDMDEDERVIVIGNVHPDYIKYLKYINKGFGFRFIK